MGAAGIFLKLGDELTLLKETPYDSEDILQEALAKFPEVLAGPTTEGGGDARLMLVSREMGVPSTEQGPSNFSLDHLFIDHECVPVLVEVKRASDTRIRREVVGQMLDYAANAVKHWPLSLIRQALDRRASDDDTSVEELLAELRPDQDPEDFWNAVESNLMAGRVRMVFVADALPPELVRVIEFLNEQMNPAEVLGVELPQFVSAASVVYVPRVVGRTSAAIGAKSSSGAQWTRESFLAATRERCTRQEFQFVETLLADIQSRGVKLSWGRGATPGVGGWYHVEGRPTAVWVLNANTESPTTQAYLVFYLGDIIDRKVPDRIDAAVAHLEQIESLKHKLEEARASDWRRYPSIRLAEVVADPRAADIVLKAITELIDS
ncbi:hypothetical protein GCM10009745_69530 [Kribbella yunnanensis]|uniref:DUF91 domain-containing protein n=1 Tax=Kribbella yunnanensis TaxID=190194 RepID=A0ABN2ITJ5_9ACTN